MATAGTVVTNYQQSGNSFTSDWTRKDVTSSLGKIFQKLGEECPDLKLFHSSTLFEHIVNHKFIPGESYKTCHHGLSILAVSLHSFAVQEHHEQQENDVFQKASNITPDVYCKHHSKGPLALPQSIGDLLQLFNWLIVLTESLFTANSSMATQLCTMQLALCKHNPTLIGDPDRAVELIPQLVWAIIQATWHYYSTVCTKEDLNPEEGQPLGTAEAMLDAYTFLLKHALRMDVEDIPTQWLATHRGTAQVPHLTPTAKPNAHSDNNTTLQTNPNPTNPSHGMTKSSPTFRTYSNQPSIFANNDSLCKLKTRKGKVIWDLIMEAGVPGGESRLNMTGLPKNMCL